LEKNSLFASTVQGETMTVVTVKIFFTQGRQSN